MVVLDSRRVASAAPGVVAVADAGREALIRSVAAGTIPRPRAVDIYCGRPGPGPEVDFERIADALEAELPVHRVDMGPLTAAIAHNPTEQAMLVDCLGQVDEEELRRRQSVPAYGANGGAGVVARLAIAVVAWLARHGVTPARVTATSATLVLSSAALCLPGTRPAYLVAASALAISFLLDGIDTSLARYAYAFDAVGGPAGRWIVRARQHLVLVGLAAGATWPGATATWILAAATSALLLTERGVRPGSGRTEPRAEARSRLGRLVCWLGELSRVERRIVTCVVIAATSPVVAFAVLAALSASAIRTGRAGSRRRAAGR